MHSNNFLPVRLNENISSGQFDECKNYIGAQEIIYKRNTISGILVRMPGLLY